MSVHKVAAIPGKFKDTKMALRKSPSAVATRIKEKREQRAANRALQGKPK
jgi:hypothetical protein